MPVRSRIDPAATVCTGDQISPARAGGQARSPLGIPQFATLRRGRVDPPSRFLVSLYIHGPIAIRIDWRKHQPAPIGFIDHGTESRAPCIITCPQERFRAGDIGACEAGRPQDIRPRPGIDRSHGDGVPTHPHSLSGPNPIHHELKRQTAVPHGLEIMIF